MIDQAILNFPRQFMFKPVIKNLPRRRRYDCYVICGMGGSHLAADILKLLRPNLNLVIHSDYGLPFLSEKIWRRTLIIVSSYSGNTVEAIDSFNMAQKLNLPLVAISVGGQLLDLARRHSVPYIELPDTSIQPRLALGFSLRALLQVIGDRELLRATKDLAKFLQPAELMSSGQELAKQIHGLVPVIYASRRNYALAYNWKIKLNETGKIPAFYNLLPELNHNEMNSFAYTAANKDLATKFIFIMLADKNDDPRVIRRMEVLMDLLAKRDLSVITVSIAGETGVQAIFNNLLTADWLAYYTALQYNAEPEAVPMVEEFKRILRSSTS